MRTMLLLAAGAVVLLCVGFLWFLRIIPDAEPLPLPRAEGIVVLTGGAFRISDALELLASGHGKRLLITGVHPTTRSGEIARPEHQRWFGCCVDLDRSALNTIGNAVETRRWAEEHGFRSLIVVTSNFHMPRSLMELEHQLPGVALVPFPVISERVRVDNLWSSQGTARLLFYEYLKYIAAWARTRLEVVLP